MIPEKMYSKTELDVPGLDLTELSALEIILRQYGFYKCIQNPEVVSAHVLAFELEAEDALHLDHEQRIEIQLLYTTPDGIPHMSDVTYTTADECTKEGMYGRGSTSSGS